MTGLATDPRWDPFVDEVASIGNLARDAIGPDSRLLADLGLDSLAIAELVVYVLGANPTSTLAQELESRDWSTTTVLDLYRTYAGPVASR